MKKIIAQIYEIQTPAEAAALLEIGADRIGSILLSEQEWKIPLIREVTHMVAETDSQANIIPLFNTPDNVFRALDYYRPDIIHFCESLAGPEGISDICNDLIKLQEELRKRFPEIRIMRSIPIAQNGKADLVPSLEVARMFEPVSDYFLTDTLIIANAETDADQPVKGFVGITGTTCDWDVARDLVESSQIPVILAGGISPENVADGIRHVMPAGVDSCTGTNATDAKGHPIRFKKDMLKVRQLIESIRQMEQDITKTETDE